MCNARAAFGRRHSLARRPFIASGLIRYDPADYSKHERWRVAAFRAASRSESKYSDTTRFIR